jgi:A/G-specific adenine glycosylase
MIEKKNKKEAPDAKNGFQAIKTFRKEVLGYFKKYGRELPWRKTSDPYHILVSEIMLQQTQVDRVIDKYKEFIRAFPDFRSLSRAPLTQVYSVWQGLGYNRRALALKNIASAVVNEYGGQLPETIEALSSLPGIGKATASSICAFGFNKPTVFIETNIRTVFIHHFFSHHKENVDDKKIAALAEAALDKNDPCKWYSALMDYGTMLKKKYPELTRKSAQYKKQSPFKGSRRQVRGKLLRILLEHPQSTETMLVKKIAKEKKEFLKEILEELVKDGLVKREKGRYSIA